MDDSFDFLDFLYNATNNPDKMVQDLDEAWRKFCMTGDKAIYDSTVQSAKLCGRRVFRNSQGRHRVD